MNNELDPAENSDMELLSVNWTGCRDTRKEVLVHWSPVGVVREGNVGRW